ncbi:MOSC and FAD-binding oxidoreductase domain-containing protein [Mucilaginibacter sabulilitoris]|uniref:MOSC and FAD-binding oxidoreductase domain-containing protein n=1 Tax=Mucilaginibacter sabulilitoris TaxID=1173583 RepID=A0ABZ0TRY3_9SPHI|nr:MOSC and FAD-binding oxidoreductase domain-containing protein [Mucilaginibacter sabulilitoris]WPU94833.1 MOSC and FAD-binding oxidoreductase domain-containing protein [Mucilaginibacter sabulilitoris]
MKVLSINVGMSQEVEFRGKLIKTSIFKKPVKGKVTVRRLNIDGDCQTDLIGHGGEHRAVMVYQAESYHYWSKQLNREDLFYGQFGENLTVEGLADKEVYIGDHYEIGTAIFEVTQPRVTCYRVGISMGVPEMPALLVSHKRPGFYFRVIREGEIAAGDLIKKIADGPGKMSIADVDSLLYSKNHPTEELVRAINIPALSDGWRQSFQDLLKSSQAGIAEGNTGLSGVNGRPLAWAGYRQFVIADSHLETTDIKSFELRPADGKSLASFLPGQHIAIRIPAGRGKALLTRMFSLCGPAGGDRYRIAVKREKDGLCSAYMHDQLQKGDTLEVSAPRGEFILSDLQCPVVLLSAGVGITPMLGMLYTLEENMPTREIWWIHSARNESSYPFLKEVEEIRSRLSAFHALKVYSQPAEGEQIGIHYDFQGHLSLSVLKSLNLPSGCEYYLCGPPGYLSDTTAALVALGVSDAQIKSEIFGDYAASTVADLKPHLPPDNDGKGPLINFTKSNIAFHWSPRYDNILEAAEACDIPVHWSCRVGVCHRCESSLLDGKIKYTSPPLDPPATGRLLICCSVPFSDLDLDL